MARTTCAARRCRRSRGGGSRRPLAGSSVPMGALALLQKLPAARATWPTSWPPLDCTPDSAEPRELHGTAETLLRLLPWHGGDLALHQPEMGAIGTPGEEVDPPPLPLERPRPWRPPPRQMDLAAERLLARTGRTPATAVSGLLRARVAWPNVAPPGQRPWVRPRAGSRPRRSGDARGELRFGPPAAPRLAESSEVHPGRGPPHARAALAPSTRWRTRCGVASSYTRTATMPAPATTKAASNSGGSPVPELHGEGHATRSGRVRRHRARWLLPGLRAWSRTRRWERWSVPPFPTGLAASQRESVTTAVSVAGRARIAQGSEGTPAGSEGNPGRNADTTQDQPEEGRSPRCRDRGVPGRV